MRTMNATLPQNRFDLFGFGMDHDFAEYDCSSLISEYLARSSLIEGAIVELNIHGQPQSLTVVRPSGESWTFVLDSQTTVLQGGEAVSPRCLSMGQWIKILRRQLNDGSCHTLIFAREPKEVGNVKRFDSVLV